MVDPGGAIGAVSLGLQVVQGLSNYYVRFKSYHADIQAVIDRIATLDEIFRVIEQPIRNLDTGQNPVARQTRGCISKCLDVVKELEAYQKKCSETKNPADAVLKRAAYPFKKATLGEIQTLLDRMLQQLQLILEVLNL
jgi:hypothetical protein